MVLIENAVIAAAGYGSRLGKGLPKCMVKIGGGKLVLDYIILALRDYIKNIVIVVGYKGDIVEQYCKENYPFIKVIYNASYAQTNTAYSMALGAQNMQGKCLFLDADLLFTKENIHLLLERAQQEKVILGVTTNITTNPVYVDVDDSNILNFSRDIVTKYEWANIFCADAKILDSANNFVYEELQKYPNLKYHDINLFEIDTIEDLEKAKKHFDLL